MKEKLMLLFVSIFLSVNAAVAQKTVTGTVTEEGGSPLIGVSIAVKGGSPVAVTDFDGNYSAQVKDGAVLIFSYLGMQSKEVKVTGSVHDVVLTPESNTITELVVTAMGVSQEKKKMNFAVQALSTEELTASKATNFVESLRGKIAGVNFTNSGGSPNSSSQLIIRGISSINPSMSNEPLYVIDGMHMSGGASSMATINPNDIENVTVLKGAAASALYGQEGANGVVMITTKSGTKGKLSVVGSASIQLDEATRLPEIQGMYVPGVQGVLKDRNWTGGWGPRVKAGETIYDNTKDYFNTGLLHKYDVSLSGGSDKFATYASVNYQKHDGVIINDYVNRVGMMLKASFDPSPTVNVSFMANLTNSESRDASNQALAELKNSTANPMMGVYSWAIVDEMANYKNDDGTIRWLLPYDESVVGNVISPYWRRYEDGSKSESIRNLLQTAATWKPIKGLALSGRLGYDSSDSQTNTLTTPRYLRAELNDLYQEALSTDYYGTYKVTQSRSSVFSAQAMATYRQEVFDDFAAELLLGTETKIYKAFSTSMFGTEFIQPGFYSYKNLKNLTMNDLGVNRGKSKKYGFFGELRFDYKGVLQLSGTLRNDQTSTLAEDNRSYYYPSVTAGFIFSELFNLRNDIFDYGKIRGNWAKVGKDANRYLFGQKFTQKATFPDGGIGVNPTLAVATLDLQPEMSKSWEIGADLRFFKGKTSLDIAYYSQAVDNQIVTVRVSPSAGMILQTRNEGDIENYGMEATLNQEILSTKDFQWTATVNWSFNRGRVRGLPNELLEVTTLQVGDTYATAYLNGAVTAISGKDYLRNAEGKIIVNEQGIPQINPNKALLLGDREPDFIAGLGSSFKYKEFGLSFLIDFRKGGDVVNATSRSLWSSGQSKRLETYRNRELVFDGVVLQSNGKYAPNTKAVVFDQTFIDNYFVGVSSNFVEDGSYARLSYVTLSYDLSKFVKKTPIKGLDISLTGRNLLLLTRYSGSDPDINQGATGGAGSMGFDNLNVPKTRSVNLSLNVTF